MFFDSRATCKECEVLLKERFEIVKSEIIPTRTIPAITDEPIIWRYFVAPLKSVLASMQLDEKEFVARTVMKSNTEMKGAYVFSSGKNMGTFKAVGVRANTTLIKEIGDEVNRGILVNDRMETSLESIYAAGDCTKGNDIFLGQKRVLALLPNAYMQEHTAGVNMTGGNEVFGKAIPMNSIGFFGLHIMKAGTYVGEMYEEKSDSTLKRLFTKDGLLKGFILIDKTERAGIYTSLIRERTPLDTIDFETMTKVATSAAFSPENRRKKFGGVV